MDHSRALLALQAELIELQDWVVDHKQKVVVIFEGRDAAGKGGVIKRITQRLNPRNRQNGGAAGAVRSRKDPMVFPALTYDIPPAGGEIVLFDRSWYNRCGVERVMGFATEEEVEQFFDARAGIRTHAGALRRSAG